MSTSTYPSLANLDFQRARAALSTATPGAQRQRPGAHSESMQDAVGRLVGEALGTADCSGQLAQIAALSGVAIDSPEVQTLRRFIAMRRAAETGTDVTVALSASMGGAPRQRQVVPAESMQDTVGRLVSDAVGTADCSGQLAQIAALSGVAIDSPEIQTLRRVIATRRTAASGADSSHGGNR